MSDRRDLISLLTFICIDEKLSHGFRLYITRLDILKLLSCNLRSEPSSRNFLNGEQPYPWDLLQPRDKLSRHRGAELRRRLGLLGGTSLFNLSFDN